MDEIITNSGEVTTDIGQNLGQILPYTYQNENSKTD